MATLGIIIGIIILAYDIFLNGYMVCETMYRYGDPDMEEDFVPFYVKWHSHVCESEDLLIGKILMNIQYFVPALMSFFSWIKFEKNANKEPM